MANTRFFSAHHQDLLKNLDLPTLVPVLNSKELLNSSDHDNLTNIATSRGDKIDLLVRVMGAKGENAPAAFIRSLREEKQHLPHKELADKMEAWLNPNSASCSGKSGIEGSLSAATGHSITLMNCPFNVNVGPVTFSFNIFTAPTDTASKGPADYEEASSSQKKFKQSPKKTKTVLREKNKKVTTSGSEKYFQRKLHNYYNVIPRKENVGEHTLSTQADEIRSQGKDAGPS